MEISLIKILLRAYIISLWLLPFIKVIKSYSKDDRFYFRKFLFPLPYLFQVLFEKMTNNNRTGTRTLQIIAFLFSEFWTFIPMAILSTFHIKYDPYFIELIILMFGCPVIFIPYFFQPFAHQIYKTK